MDCSVSLTETRALPAQFFWSVAFKLGDRLYMVLVGM